MESEIGGNTTRDGPGSAAVVDDREWIDRIRSGSARALETLFRNHASELTAFAFRYVQSYEAAVRVVRDVYTRLWRGRHSWAFHGSVRGNLFASAHRVALEELHRTHCEARWHAGLPTPSTQAKGAADDEHGTVGNGPEDLYAVVQTTIARLPALTRTVGFMRWSDRLSRAEIATVLGSNVRTVHTQLTPASRAMRKRLAPSHWALERRPSTSTLRDPIDGVDPFPTIDPDRIEFYLAGESQPDEVEQLRRDVSDVGGDPAAFDAMESAWYGPGRIIADVVDCDALWIVIARDLTLPIEQADRAVRRRWSMPDVLGSLKTTRVQPDQNGSAPSRDDVSLEARRPSLADSTRRLGRQTGEAARRVAGDVAGHVRASIPHIMQATTRLTQMSRVVARIRAVQSVAIVVAGLAVTGGMWAFAWRHAQAVAGPAHETVSHAALSPAAIPPASPKPPAANDRRAAPGRSQTPLRPRRRR
jgi:DNA-directed RNA polymerase specialized sigma24 family protein